MHRVIIAMVLFAMTAVPSFATDLHLITLTQDDTEIEVSVDRGTWQTEELEKGFNYRVYDTEARTPTAEVMSYGDVIPLKTIQGRSGDWYCVVRLAPPRDGDGENAYR